MLPKTLIFTITYSGKDYCLDEFIENAQKINYPNYKHIMIDNTADGGVYYNKIKEKLEPLGIEVYRTERGNNSREALARSQNFARDYALENNYDYMFSLESDIFPPHDIIQNLIGSGKRVITGLYFIGTKNLKVPCITLLKFNNTLGAWGTRLLAVDEFNAYIRNGVKQVAAGGFGCCLIERAVFEKIEFYYDSRLSGHSDVYFFNDCFRNKIYVYVDTDIVCEHKNSEWSDVEDR